MLLFEWCRVGSLLLPLTVAVFWDVAPCSVVEVYQFIDVSEVLAASIIRAINKLLLHYTAQKPGKQSSSYSPP
jgi:hypothetical protein